ncbi:MAG: dehydrogenase, partial [Aquificaceae bacterium]|nr:dehydrogenase [Aquificaceae bacterium]
MNLAPTKVPLTVKEFDREVVGLCAGCGCGCGYLLYLKGEKVVDLYGHPADRRGMGSFCTKGITYVQEAPQNPLRLKGAFLREGENFVRIEYQKGVHLLREKLSKGRTAFLLGREAGLEEYLLFRELGEVFVDAPVVDFAPSTLEPTQWKEAKFILSVDAEPVFSEVMSTRWLVDAVERGAYLFCLSSRYETLCAKARERLLLKPDLMVEFLLALLEPGRRDQRVDLLKKSLFLLRGALLLVGAHLLASPFREAVMHLLAQLREKYGVNYSLVGDLMPFPAGTLEEFLDKLEEFQNVVVVGNLLRYLSDQHLESLKGRFVVSFQVFPNLSAHYCDLLFASTLFCERDFINYRHGFGYLLYSPSTLRPEAELFSPYRVVEEAFQTSAELGRFLEGYGVDYEELLKEREARPRFGELRRRGGYLLPTGKVFLYADRTLVEDMGHWNPWTHEMERLQKAYVNPRTARELGLKERLKVGSAELELQLTENVAEGVVFIPSEFEEFQPFDPGHRVGVLLKKPFQRY